MLILALVPTTAFAAAAPSDISTHWANSQITSMVNGGLVNGYPDGTFLPDASITRAEFMQIVNGAFAYTEKAAVSFTDVPADAWYADAVAKAAKAAYITGYPDGTMLPNAPITRQEAATIIMKVKDLTGTSENLSKFTDFPAIPGWSKNAVGATVVAKIMNGYPDGSFAPANNISRAEAVTALNKAMTATIGTVYDKAGVYGSATEGTTIQGDVFIKAPGVTLQNMTITGNLTIAKEVGEGDVTLKSVIIQGSTYVNGGGVNSIYFINVTTGKVYVLKDDGPVRIVASGTSSIEEVMAGSSVKLEEVNMTGSGFEGITVEANAAGGIEITLVDVQCDTFDINAVGVTVNMDENSTVATMTVNAADTQIDGEGVVTSAVINADGIDFQTEPTGTTTKEGVEPATVTPPSTGGGGGGGGGTTTPAAQLTGGTADFTSVSDVTGTVSSGNTITFNLTGKQSADRLSGFAVTAQGTALTVTQVAGQSGLTQSMNQAVSNLNAITVQSLLGTSDISLGGLKSLFGEKLTITGTLTAGTGYANSTVYMVINLSNSVSSNSDYNNVWSVVTISGDTVTCDIITGKGSITLSQIPLPTLLGSVVGATPAEVSFDNGSNYTEMTASDYSAVLDKLAVAAGKPYGTITLDNLADLTPDIMLKKQGSSREFTINIIK